MPNNELRPKLLEKYGDDIMADLAFIKKEEITFAEAARTYGVSYTLMRKIFFSFYTKEDLKGTKWEVNEVSHGVTPVNTVLKSNTVLTPDTMNLLKKLIGRVEELEAENAEINRKIAPLLRAAIRKTPDEDLQERVFELDSCYTQLKERFSVVENKVNNTW